MKAERKERREGDHAKTSMKMSITRTVSMTAMLTSNSFVKTSMTSMIIPMLLYM